MYIHVYLALVSYSTCYANVIRKETTGESSKERMNNSFCSYIQGFLGANKRQLISRTPKMRMSRMILTVIVMRAAMTTMIMMRTLGARKIVVHRILKMKMRGLLILHGKGFQTNCVRYYYMAYR